MKKKYLFSFALAAALLSACSNDETVSDNAHPGFNAKGNAYVNLAINLPIVKGSGTRATGNFDDGEENEYRVNDATLVIFSGENEANATLASAYDLKLSFNLDDDNTNQITSSAKIVQEIKKAGTTGNLYAYVILNKDGVFGLKKLSTEPDDNYSELLDATGKPFQKDTKFSDFVSKITTTADLTGGGNSFFMTNAPVTNKAGGTQDPTGATITTLSAINPNNIYPTEAQAAASPATAVYVERANAKVTVKNSSNGKTEKDNLPYTIKGWMLDNTNTSTTVTRNFDPAWADLKTNAHDVTAPYRFVEEKAIVNGVYRTYWGKDINYNAAAKEGELETINNDNTQFKGQNLNTNAYCFENTFDVERQNKDQTTRVVVAAEFNGGKPFFTAESTINKGSSDTDKGPLYTSLQDFEDFLKGKVLSMPDVKQWVKENVNGEVTGQDITITLDNTTKAGPVVVTGVSLKDNVSLKVGADFSTTAKTIKDNLNTDKYNYYEGGISYYQARIKHFGDDLTPWDKSETPPPSEGEIYPAGNANANYLGRYGVLRNNWYQINVNNIATIGSPTVPSITGDNTPDDDKESYISVDINILPWAVRAQDVDL